MKTNKTYPVILMVDDDPDDYYLTKAALEESGAQTELYLVADGQELLDYLFCQGKFADSERAAHPSLILLDLNMPIKNGKEALTALKADPGLRQIPVVIYTNSTAEEDIVSSYQLGASSYIPKPASFQSLVETMGTLSRYWLDIAMLPFMESGTPETGEQALAR
ncbi:MAG: response regulator [Desulfatiglandaceae bacterium]